MMNEQEWSKLPFKTRFIITIMVSSIFGPLFLFVVFLFINNTLDGWELH
jgi:hypothetical protein